jgi:hypothetical protein
MQFDYASVKEWLQSHVHQTITIQSCASDFELMSQILNCHPDKPKWKHQNPKSFIITRSSKKKSLLDLVQCEGLTSPRLVSWVACAKQKIKKTDRLTQAMRSAIKPQIHFYREHHHSKNCVICDCTHSIEVDHYPETFASIKHSFINNNVLTQPLPTKFNWNGRYYVFSGKDQHFSNEWEIFHKDRAKYRYLCAKCNQSKLT